MNNAVKLYGDNFDSYGETYDEEDSNEEEELKPNQSKINGMEDNKLLKQLEPRNGFNEASKLINDTKINTNNVEVA